MSESDAIFQFKVTLKEIQPPNWRRFQVRSDITFRDLHDTLQVVMGWWNTHLHLFQFGRLLLTDADTLAEWGEEGLRDDTTPPLVADWLGRLVLRRLPRARPDPGAFGGAALCSLVGQHGRSGVWAGQTRSPLYSAGVGWGLAAATFRAQGDNVSAIEKKSFLAVPPLSTIMDSCLKTCCKRSYISPGYGRFSSRVPTSSKHSTTA